MRGFLLAMGMLVGAATPTLAQQNNPSGHEKQIMDEIARKFETGFNHKDAAAVAGLSTENIIEVEPDGILQGRDALKKRLENEFKSGAHDLAIDVQVAYTAGETIVSAGEWRGNLGEHPVHGYWSTVSVRDGNQWKRRQNASSIDPPPAPAK